MRFLPTLRSRAKHERENPPTDSPEVEAGRRAMCNHNTDAIAPPNREQKLRDPMAFQYPLLQNDGPAFLPPKGAGCPICGAEFKTGVIFFSAGAVPDDEDIAKLRAFMQLGFHSSAIDCSGSVNIDVVNDLKYGQFDMSFCSIPCLRKFFETLINDLAQQMNP